MYIISDVREMKGEEFTIDYIDEKIKEAYEGYFQPIDFNQDSLTYKFRDTLLKIKILFTKKHEITRLNTVKIIDIEAI